MACKPWLYWADEPPLRGTRRAEVTVLPSILAKVPAVLRRGARAGALQAARLAGTTIGAIAESSWGARISANNATGSSERY